MCRIGTGLHAHGLAIELEAAFDQPVPEVQFLPNVLNLIQGGLFAIGTEQPQREPAQVEPMGILSQPIIEVLLTSAAGGIADRPAVGIVGR